MDTDKTSAANNFPLTTALIALVLYGGFVINAMDALQNETSDPTETQRIEQTGDNLRPLVLQPVKPQPLARKTLDLIPQ